MESQPLDLTIISARGLKRVNFFRKMEVFAIASLSNDPRSMKRTPVDKEGGKNPTWNFSTEFYIPTSDSYALFLQIHLKCRRFLRHSVVGEVNIPVRDLLLAEGKQMHFVSYQVRKPSGKPKGVLSLSFKLRERVFVKTDELVTAYPQPALAYGYPPAGHQGYGYGFGYPPSGPLGYGYGYGYPPRAPQREGKKRSKLGMGFLGGALGALLIGDMIAN